MVRRFSYTLMGLALLATITGCASMQGHTVDLGYVTTAALTPTEVTLVLTQGETAAWKENSLLRVDADGNTKPTRMHIIVVDRHGKVVGRRSMEDAWAGSVSIAHAKAFTAMAFSSDENALTTRSVGALSQPGGPLWQIGNSNSDPGLIEFPGGVPLYKNGQLVGAVGVSGDGVDQDERVAAAAAKGYEPAKTIRIDTVTNNAVPYTK